MHIGVLKCVLEMKEAIEEMQRFQQQAASLERSRPAWAGSAQANEAEGQLQEMQQSVQMLQHHVLMFQAALEEPQLVADAIAFYRVMAAWLTRLACAGGPVVYPLPSPCPKARAPRLHSLPARSLCHARQLRRSALLSTTA
jgi:ubiquitin conjugation factor E4 B